MRYALAFCAICLNLPVAAMAESQIEIAIRLARQSAVPMPAVLRGGSDIAELAQNSPAVSNAASRLARKPAGPPDL
ncbi:hypothetical protein GCM10010961_16350 [Pseudodonghicola xiamenensis]|uniref:Uncharacterized protein n=1 Tax=Pseudodonghicola xiamenensis TaxID=337702 RepID=A0A8J3H790_9RHOB|nr:hypothetical protein GCM10010961_16350 [Pseudodonghicola xiamenensis]